MGRREYNIGKQPIDTTSSSLIIHFTKKIIKDSILKTSNYMNTVVEITMKSNNWVK